MFTSTTMQRNRNFFSVIGRYVQDKTFLLHITYCPSMDKNMLSQNLVNFVESYLMYSSSDDLL